MTRRLLRLAERWKPAAAARTHLFAAAFLWSAVGLGLAAVGLRWCARLPLPLAPLPAAAGLLAGLAKGRFVLRRVAERNAARIAARGDGRCLGGFLSWRTWLLVAVMMGSGMLLRRSALPRPLLGFLYVAVGTALLCGSRVVWQALARGRGGC